MKEKRGRSDGSACCDLIHHVEFAVDGYGIDIIISPLLYFFFLSSTQQKNQKKKKNQKNEKNLEKNQT